MVEVRLYIAGRPAGKFLCLGNDLLEHFDVKTTSRCHTGNNTDAADSHVGVFVRQQNSGTDTLIAATGRVGAVNARQDGNALLRQLSVPIEGRACTAPVGVELFLLGQFCTAAVGRARRAEYSYASPGLSPGECFRTVRATRLPP